MGLFSCVSEFTLPKPFVAFDLIVTHKHFIISVITEKFFLESHQDYQEICKKYLSS
jgi:hypothetical protein